jgi:hypothetical protein
VKGSLANAIYRTSCSRWSCPRCASERQAIAATGIAREIIKHKMRSFLTLTLPSDYSGKRFIVKDERNPDRRGIYRRLAQDVNLFLTRLRQKHPDLSFIRVIERNLSKKLPHIHLVISPKTSTSAVSEIWHSITGGTAYSKAIQLTPESATRLGAYMSKQLCNGLQLSDGSRPPERYRRIASSRSCDIFNRKNKPATPTTGALIFTRPAFKEMATYCLEPKEHRKFGPCSEIADLLTIAHRAHGNAPSKKLHSEDVLDILRSFYTSHLKRLGFDIPPYSHIFLFRNDIALLQDVHLKALLADNTFRADCGGTSLLKAIHELLYPLAASTTSSFFAWKQPRTQQAWVM